jgi:hypothetical protein
MAAPASPSGAWALLPTEVEPQPGRHVTTRTARSETPPRLGGFGRVRPHAEAADEGHHPEEQQEAKNAIGRIIAAARSKPRSVRNDGVVSGDGHPARWERGDHSDPSDPACLTAAMTATTSRTARSVRAHEDLTSKAAAIARASLDLAEIRDEHGVVQYSGPSGHQTRRLSLPPARRRVFGRRPRRLLQDRRGHHEAPARITSTSGATLIGHRARLSFLRQRPSLLQTPSLEGRARDVQELGKLSMSVCRTRTRG